MHYATERSNVRFPPNADVRSAFDPLQTLRAGRSVLPMWRAMAISVLFVGSLSGAAASQEVVSPSRLSPTRLVHSVSGYCGPHMYRIELRHDGERNILSVEANGRAVGRSEIGKVTMSVRPGYFMYDPFLAECFRDRPNARMRLITDGPRSGGDSQTLSFEVSPAGLISEVRAD